MKGIVNLLKKSVIYLIVFSITMVLQEPMGVYAGNYTATGNGNGLGRATTTVTAASGLNKTQSITYNHVYPITDTVGWSRAEQTLVIPSTLIDNGEEWEFSYALIHFELHEAANYTSSYTMHCNGHTLALSAGWVSKPANVTTTMVNNSTCKVDKAGTYTWYSYEGWINWTPGWWESTARMRSVTSYYVKKGYNHILNYNANGGTGAPSTQNEFNLNENHTLTISSSKPTRTGYTFQGWSESSTATTASYQPGGTITIGANASKTLYAVWKANTYYVDYSSGLNDNVGTTNKTTHTYDTDVTLASNGFTGMSYSINFDANKPSNATGTVANMPSNISGNLQFDKWSVSATNNSGEYSDNTNLGVKNFESTDGATAHATALWKKSYYYETKQPTLKDWEFVGWSTDKDATSGDLIAAADILPNASAFNKTLYAIWKPVEYKITYSANGATNVPSTQTKKADTSIKLSNLVPERQFYSFIEWNTKEDGRGTSYQPSQTYSTNADLTLYAIFDYSKDSIYYYKGLTNDTTHTDIIKATRNSNIQSNSLLTHPYTQWVMNSNILIAGIGTVKGREYKVNFDYNIPVSATNEQKDTAIISGYTNDANGKTTYKVNDYLKFTKWSLTGSKLLPPTIEPEQTYKPVYRKHVHSGSSSTGGGCYNIKQQKTESYTTTCGCASCWCEGFNGISDNWNCVHCGHGHMGPHGDGVGTGNGRCTATKRVSRTVVYYELGCGKTQGVRYQDEGIEYYAIDGDPNYTGPFGTEATNKIATAIWKNVTFGNFKTPTMDGWKFMGWYDNQAGNNSTAVSTVLKTKDTDYYTNKINTTTDKSANSNVKVYGDLTEYTVEPSTGIFDRTLYARWQRTITLTLNLNGGQYLGKTDPIVMTGIYYNNADGYNFSINDTLTQKHLPDYETQISNYKLNGTQKGIDAYGTYNSNGENNKYTLIKDDGSTYRFLGWSTNPSATEPDSGLSVYDNNHKLNYRIYKDTTLYAVWEPVITVNMQVYRTLGNMKFNDGSSPKTDISGIKASDGLQQLQVIAKPGEQCGYTIALTGDSNTKVGIQFDTKITDIYNHQGAWTDNLNPSTEEDLVSNQNHGLDRNIQLTNRTATRKFYIPQYLGTDKSYTTSQGIKVYTADLIIQQDSYYYKCLGTNVEEIPVHITIYLTTDPTGKPTPTPTPDNPTPNDPDPIVSVLDELRTKLKIRLK